MFEHKAEKKSSPTSLPASKPVSGDLDIIIHSYPKEFYDREVRWQDEPPQLKPVVAPPPVPKPAVALNVKPIVHKQALPPPAKKSNSKVILVVILSVLLIVGAGLATAYSLGVFEKSQPTPTPVPEPEPTPEPEPIKPTPEPVKPVNGIDTDSDGLTNVEELLYGTDFRNPDSDGDTYLDGNEVFHRFDPRGLAPSTLLDTGSVRILESLELPFAMFYPITWNPVSAPTTKRVTFRAATNAEIVVTWNLKDPQLTLADWYTQTVNVVDTKRLQPTTPKEGYEVLIAPDERIMYLLAGDQVYTFTYTLGDINSIEFLQTFKMMANSFKLVP